MWEEPAYAHFLTRLSELGRLITYDRRGSGLSARQRMPTIETRVEDIVRLLDATDVDTAVIAAAGGSTQSALVFAASHPDRCAALVLYAASARTSQAPDYDIGTAADVVEWAIEVCPDFWGTGITTGLYAPSLVDDRDFTAWSARLERAVATPMEATEWIRMYDETDVRPVLTHVRAPTLVLTPRRAKDPVPRWSEYVAEHVSGASHVRIDAMDEWPYTDGRTCVLDAIADFLPQVVDLGPAELVHRRLAAVLFSDIVASTEQLRAHGDHEWRTLLDTHDATFRRLVTRRGGTLVKSTGDGVLAVFDGPAAAVHTAMQASAALVRLGIEIRAGVHFGEIETRGDDVAGVAVHLASRIADRAAPNEVLVTATVRDLVAGSGLDFDERGEAELKGMANPVTVLSARHGFRLPRTSGETAAV
jgi:class 3 adenylate cyclase